MKFFIPSKDRARTIRTHRLLYGAEWYVVVHNWEQAQKYRRNPTIPASRIIVTNVEFNLGKQRQFIMDNFVPFGEWFCLLDDNINAIQVLPPPHYWQQNLNLGPRPDNKLWARRFNTPAHFQGPLLQMALEDSVVEAEKRGAFLVGTATNDNRLFRQKKFRDVGFVNGKMMIIRRGDCRFEPLPAKSDYGFTVQNLIRYGRVLINNFIYPNGRQGQLGGSGPLDKRAGRNRAAAHMLMDKYPGLFRFRPRPGRLHETEIILRVTNREQLQKWISLTEKKRLSIPA